MKPLPRTARWMTALAAVLLMTSLSSCAAPSGGQSAAQASAAAATIDGVTEARVRSSGSWSGLQRSVHSTVSLPLDDSYEVADADALIDWALATAWS